jgi:hypothetical protein
MTISKMKRDSLAKKPARGGSVRHEEGWSRSSGS